MNLQEQQDNSGQLSFGVIANRAAETTSERLQWAISSGFPVFPLWPGTKRPQIRGWQVEATDSEDQIKRWANEHPDCNFGVVTGRGLYCLDVDHHLDQENGFEVLKAMGINVPETFSVSTPRRGKHFYFRFTGPELRTRKIAPGLDFKGAGGYVVAPYSRLASAGSYSIDQPEASIADLPDWLRAPIQETASSGSKNLPFPIMGEEELTAPKRRHLCRILSKINPSAPYSYWRDAIFASFNVWGYTLNVADELAYWSSASEKWDETAFRRVVASFDPGRQEKLGLPRLRRLAVENPRVLPTPIVVSEDDAPAVRTLTARVLTSALSILRANSNEPTEQHAGALEDLARSMAAGLYSKEPFRNAYPLATGMGKTTLCIALCEVIFKERLQKSIAIYVETVEQAGELKEALTRLGVVESEIGILHSTARYREDVPPIEPRHAPRYRFLIACHARARSSSRAGRVEELLQFQGRKRDLIIWDESMITSAGHQERRLDVIDAASVWLNTYRELLSQGRHSINNKQSVDELQRFLAAATKSLSHAEDGIVFIRGLTQEPSSYVHPIENVLSHRPAGSLAPRTGEILRKLVEFTCRGDIRILDLGKGGHALVQFETVIDKEFDKIIILDASAPIRDLIDYDETIKVQACRIEKDYSTVALNVAPVPSSKSSFRSDSGQLGRYFDEIRHVLKGVPEHDEVLIFCHLEDQGSVETFAKSLERLGRVHVLHWGQHRATNQFAGAKWMFTVGVMYLPRDVVASMIIGQTGNLAYELSAEEVTQVLLSEQAEMLYQAISRGHCRRNIGGKAGQQSVYLFHPPKETRTVVQLLSEIMPGLEIKRYSPEFLAVDSGIARQAAEYEDRIIAALSSVKLDKTSIRWLCKVVGAESNSRAWRDYALPNALEQLGWRKLDRSWIVRNETQ